MYFADLTPCSYCEPEPSGLSVGWLDKAHRFPRGEVPEGFVERLIELCKSPAVSHRGYHLCEFCGVEEFDDAFNYDKAKAAGVLSWTVIRVTGLDGTIYYSPGMICHYVVEHGYQPPAEYVTAVMQTGVQNQKQQAQ
jgi:hypothetical protein